MAKIKTKPLAIDWVEEKTGYLVGTISDTGPGMTRLVEELLTMPIDNPTLKHRDVYTRDVVIRFPKAFSDERKNEFFEEFRNIYSDWKVELTSDAVHATVPEYASEQVA